MDDAFENPSVVERTVPSGHENADVDSSGEEDMPDWTKFASLNPSKPAIPKRGEKDFEPAISGPSALQEYSLDRARAAMIGALGATRSISSKSVSHAVWLPGLARAHVVQARGIHFSSMGHTVRRPNSPVCEETTTGNPRPQKIARMELLPEETLYLIEKGSLQCWKEEPGQSNQPNLMPEFTVDLGVDEKLLGTPMSVQQAYAEMIGRENLTLERYQIYAYLKRLGFLITRAEPPQDCTSYPLPPPVKRPLSPSGLSYFLSKVALRFSALLSYLLNTLINCWSPLGLRGLGWRLRVINYPSIYRNLQVIPAGHSVPLSSRVTKDSSPYKVFYHVWKPNTPWKKSSLAPPDFEFVVIDATTTPMPTIQELDELFDDLPLSPVPQPRQRGQASSTAKLQPPAIVSDPPPTAFTRILSFLGIFAKNRQLLPQPPPHPFAALKAGKKNVIVAIVDNGTNSFIRLGQGCFEEWPMI